jgi:hypothetical protein
MSYPMSKATLLEHLSDLSRTTKCDQIDKNHGFGRTLVVPLSPTQMFNKQASGLTTDTSETKSQQSRQSINTGFRLSRS